MKLIYPLTDKFIGMIPRTLGILLLCILSVTIITDFIITLINVLKLPKRINRLVDIENKLNDISVSIGKELSENTLSVQEKKIEIDGNKIKLLKTLSYKEFSGDLQDWLRSSHYLGVILKKATTEDLLIILRS